MNIPYTRETTPGMKLTIKLKSDPPDNVSHILVPSFRKSTLFRHIYSDKIIKEENKPIRTLVYGIQ